MKLKVISENLVQCANEIEEDAGIKNSKNQLIHQLIGKIINLEEKNSNQRGTLNLNSKQENRQTNLKKKDSYGENSNKSKTIITRHLVNCTL